jgi:hypothetical protein
MSMKEKIEELRDEAIDDCIEENIYAYNKVLKLVEEEPDPTKLLSAIEYILNECHKCPDDSVVDIANEAFDKIGFQDILKAEWSKDDSDKEPIILTSRAYLLKRC